MKLEVNKGKKSKESRIFENLKDIDTLEEAFVNDTRAAKIGLRGLKSTELKVSQVGLRRIFKDVLTSEDELVLTRNKIIFIKVKSAESTKKVKKITRINGKEIEKSSKIRSQQLT